MQQANLFESTNLLQAVSAQVVGDVHEVDKFTSRFNGVDNLDLVIAEYDREQVELFPNKKNTKNKSIKINGSTKNEEVISILKEQGKLPQTFDDL